MAFQRSVLREEVLEMPVLFGDLPAAAFDIPIFQHIVNVEFSEQIDEFIPVTLIRRIVVSASSSAHALAHASNAIESETTMLLLKR